MREGAGRTDWHSEAIAAGLDIHESPADRYRSLLDLARANGDDPNDVHRYVMEFPAVQRMRYVLWFRADELLSHYRVWKDTSYGVDIFWIRVLRSRANDDFLKIWLLGEDRVRLTKALLVLLGDKGINIEEQYGTVSETGFSVLSAHVEKSVIERQFGSGTHRFKGAMLCLADYLRDGLNGLFASAGCVGDHCIMGIAPANLKVRRWVSDRLFHKAPAGWEVAHTSTGWWPANQGSTLERTPSEKQLRNTFLICLSFQYPEVICRPSRDAKECGPAELFQLPGGTLRNHDRGDHHTPNCMEAPNPSEAIEHCEWDARTFSALSDSTRVLVLRCLIASKRRLSVSQIQEATGKEFATVSASLAKLKSAEFVDSIRSGKERLYAARIDLIRDRLESQLAALLANIPA